MKSKWKIRPKKCKNCGAALARKRYGKRLEDRRMFNRRQFCNRQCAWKAQEKPIAELTRTTLQQHARRMRGLFCNRCGTRLRLTTHHKDRNWRNNDPMNLETLCSSCHTSLHHAAGEIHPARPKSPCSICGRPSYRRGLCHSHLSRFKRFGDPLLVKKKIGTSWRLVRTPFLRGE